MISFLNEKLINVQLDKAGQANIHSQFNYRRLNGV